MGSIKAALEYQRVLSEMLAKITDPQDETPGGAHALQVDLKGLERLVKSLSRAGAVGYYVDPSIADNAYGTLEPVLRQLKSQGMVLLVDRRYVKIQQKQRPARKLNIDGIN